jgi:hypothetical protein
MKNSAPKLAPEDKALMEKVLAAGTKELLNEPKVRRGILSMEAHSVRKFIICGGLHSKPCLPAKPSTAIFCRRCPLQAPQNSALLS